MNKNAVIVILADMIVDITDPKITRWRREQLEAAARPVAKKYLKMMGADNDQDG